MALGGGTWLVQNKKLPGAYINFVSRAKVLNVFADRGYCAFPLKLKWGETDKVITLENSDFQTNSLKILGYSYDAEEMKPLREIFLNARTLYIYRVGVGVKAESAIATAKYKGTRGNDIKVTATTTTSDGFIIQTKIGDTVVDEQTIATNSSNDLVGNDYVDWKEDVTITAQAYSFTGGTDIEPTGEEYQAALAAFESYYFNTLGCDSENDTTKALFIAYTKRMRDEVGVKFQTVVYQKAGADYEGIISVENDAKCVYWVTGAEAGCAVNKSCSNKKYDGEYEFSVAYTQTQLSDAVDEGKFIFHRVDDEIRVLTDINTFTSFTVDKGEVFSSNQTMRVCDQIATDIAAIFNNYYLGKVPNDKSGRISLWGDIVKHHRTLEMIRAIEDFDADSVTVEQGESKSSVVVTDLVTVTNAMEKLYMTVIVA